MRRWLLLLLLAAIAARADDTAPARFAPQPGAQLPDVMLRDEAGNAVSSADYFSKPFLLVFAYHSCPQLCGLVLNSLVTALRGVDGTVGDAFDVVVVSIDPDDTPERAAAAERRYLARYERSDARGWHFLTGAAPSLHALATAAGVRYFYDPVQDGFVHPAGVILVGRGGVVRGSLEGAAFTPQALQRLLAGGDDGGGGWRRLCGIAGAADAPRTAPVLVALRIACVLAAALIAGFLASLRRRNADGR